MNCDLEESVRKEGMASNRVVIAGGSGFLGVSLSRHLVEQGMSVTILSRSHPLAKSANVSCDFEEWDGETLGEWTSVLNEACVLVNLAGRSVDCVKTPDHRDEILRSRVATTRLLGEAVRAVSAPPPVWVQMGTAHIYGDPPTAICTEESTFGYGLAPDVGRAWECAFKEARLPEQRGVILRTSFVIGKDRGAGGGALTRLKFLAKLGLGGKVGSGQQGMSWIHELDMNRIFERAIVDESMRGAYIASSPNPMEQRDFMRELRQALGVPFGLPSSEWMVRLGARFLLRTDPELALYGRHVMPKRLVEEGFEFQFRELGKAMEDLVG